MKLFFLVLRAFFYLLYHPLAFTYDIIAGVVSFGNWNTWVATVTEHIRGSRVLELGFGPGHLQVELIRAGHEAFGLDESRQMCVQTRRRIIRTFGKDQAMRLARGRAERLPFSTGSMDCVVSTFPTEYIFKLETFEEIKRVLGPDGVWVTLVGVQIGGTSLGKRLLRWVYRFSHQSPREVDLPDFLKEQFAQTGFRTELFSQVYQEDILYYLKAIPQPVES